MLRTTERIIELEEVFDYFKCKYEGNEKITNFNQIANYGFAIQQAINLLKEYQTTVEGLRREIQQLELDKRRLQVGDYSEALREQKNEILTRLSNTIEGFINDY